MKKTRRIAAFIAAMAMAATMAVPFSMTASAADYTITFDQTNGTNTTAIYAGDSATHTYEAYQIFSGTLSTKTESGTTTNVLSDIGFGSGIVFTNTQGEEPNIVTYDEAKLIEELSAIKTEKDGSISAFTGLSGKTGKALAQEIAEELKEYNNDDYAVKQFASKISNYLSSSATVPGTAGGNALTVPEGKAGYYLIQDVADSPTGAPDKSEAKTRYILAVAGDVTVKAKTAVPTVTKKVKENTDVSDYTYSQTNSAGIATESVTDADYNDVADYNIGDAVPFKVYGTLPSNYDDYEHYYYKFTDTLDSNFTAPAASDIIVKVNGVAKTNADLEKSDMKVTVSGQTITVEFEDIKELAPNSTDAVTFEYTAVLNKNAVLGIPGQRNKVDLTYSNNPNEEYTPDRDTNPDTPDTPPDTPEKPDDKGTTPEDGVIVFTYGIDINKIKSTAVTDELAGAKFAVYREVTLTGADVAAETADTPAGKYYNVVNPNATTEGTKYAVGDVVREYVWINSTTGKVTYDATAVTKDTTTDSTKGEAVFTSATGADIEIKGIDVGTYYITELEAPEGYNALSKDIIVSVSAGYITDRQAWTYGTTDAAAELALTSLYVKYNNDRTQTASEDARAVTNSTIVSEGKGIIDVVNKEGNTLPSTGGMGTKAFVAGGGLTALLAGVWLATKKRMGKED